jgi:hypothetical protein
VDSVQRGLSGIDICVFGPDPLRLLEDFPEEVQPKVNWNADIGRDEIIPIERTKSVEAIEEDDYRKENQRYPSRQGLEWGSEQECAAIHTLGLQSTVESDTCDANGAPGKE